MPLAPGRRFVARRLPSDLTILRGPWPAPHTSKFRGFILMNTPGKRFRFQMNAPFEKKIFRRCPGSTGTGPRSPSRPAFVSKNRNIEERPKISRRPLVEQWVSETFVFLRQTSARMRTPAFWGRPSFFPTPRDKKGFGAPHLCPVRGAQKK